MADIHKIHTRFTPHSEASMVTLEQGLLTGGKFPPWGKYSEFRGEMRAFENCCLFKTGDTKWFP